MRTQRHPLSVVDSPSDHEVISLHFDPVQAGLARKVYIQSSLHADEIPGMLVAHYLRERLAVLEAQGALHSEIVLVPIANPVGLAQDIQGTALGRFDLVTGINFNRGYRHLTPALAQALDGKLGSDAQENLSLIRSHAKVLMQQTSAESVTAQLKKTLQWLAVDADVVLDLHCDHQAVVHVYAGTPMSAQAMPLARYLGAQAVLVTALSGDEPFDESCCRHWWELPAYFSKDIPITFGCVAMTVELRGETDVEYGNALRDAEGILAFLQSEGHIVGDALACPAPLCEATPLEGVEPVKAAQAGILVFTKQLGQHVEAGESIGDVVDPITGAVAPLYASVAGVLFARVARRYVYKDMRVAKIAGAVAFRSGNLLSL